MYLTCGVNMKLNVIAGNCVLESKVVSFSDYITGQVIEVNGGQFMK